MAQRKSRKSIRESVADVRDVKHTARVYATETNDQDPPIHLKENSKVTAVKSKLEEGIRSTAERLQSKEDAGKPTKLAASSLEQAADLLHRTDAKTFWVAALAAARKIPKTYLVLGAGALYLGRKKLMKKAVKA